MFTELAVFGVGLDSKIIRCCALSPILDHRLNCFFNLIETNWLYKKALGRCAVSVNNSLLINRCGEIYVWNTLKTQFGIVLNFPSKFKAIKLWQIDVRNYDKRPVEARMKIFTGASY
ncbi:hypothetical protein L0659_07520 [Dyadobacter sp. CY347]|nr:hypothetical protein [Dyadobacter sp. CY347]MCF2488008.1 hypothetical protein [Dyadobacter sp. CY347]